MKNSSDTIGNQTRDLPACSTVPQLTAPPRNPLVCMDCEQFTIVMPISILCHYLQLAIPNVQLFHTLPTLSYFTL
jgi:hypothetical protein